jgi:hypothetical protein
MAPGITVIDLFADVLARAPGNPKASASIGAPVEIVS